MRIRVLMPTVVPQNLSSLFAFHLTYGLRLTHVSFMCVIHSLTLPIKHHRFKVYENQGFGPKIVVFLIRGRETLIFGFFGTLTFKSISGHSFVHPILILDYAPLGDCCLTFYALTWLLNHNGGAHGLRFFYGALRRVENPSCGS